MKIRTTKQVPVDTIQTHPRNANHGDVGAISQSLEYHGGQYRAIVVSEDTGNIVAGNHTYLAQIALGETRVLAHLIPGLTPEDEIRILTGDNQMARLATSDDQLLVDLLTELAESPDGLDATGYDGDMLDDLIADLQRDDTGRDGDLTEPPADPVTKRGDVWALGDHRLTCGDAVDVLAGMPEASGHLIATDPPYMNVVEEEWDQQWGTPADFLEWLATVLDECKRVFNSRGSLYVFASPHMAGRVEALVAQRFSVLNHIVWRKPNPGSYGGSEKDSARRFWPLSERIIFAEVGTGKDAWTQSAQRLNHDAARIAYAPMRERLVALFTASGMAMKEVDAAIGKNGMAGHYFTASQWSLPTEESWEIIAAEFTQRGVQDVPNYRTLRAEFEPLRREFEPLRREFEPLRAEWELGTDVWTFDPPVTDRHHPTQKPLPLMEHIIATSSRPGDTIVDPFAGSGSTLIAADNLGRVCHAVELDPAYCDVIVNRWESLHPDNHADLME